MPNSLQKITDAFEKNPGPQELAYLTTTSRTLLRSTKRPFGTWLPSAVKAGDSGSIPTPLPSATTTPSVLKSCLLTYLQAQRDYFGAHTYERTDRPGNYPLLLVRRTIKTVYSVQEPPAGGSFFTLCCISIVNSPRKKEAGLIFQPLFAVTQKTWSITAGLVPKQAEERCVPHQPFVLA